MSNKVYTLGSKDQNEALRVDWRRWYSKLLSWWWLFGLSLLLFVAGGHLYLRYVTPEYAARAVLLIKDTDRGAGLLEDRILLSDQGYTGGGKSMDNIIQILNSLNLMEKVIEKLSLNVTYFRQGRIKEREIYRAPPIVLDTFMPLEPTAEKGWFAASFLLDPVTDSTFTFKFDEEDEGQVYAFGEPFITKAGRFTISTIPDEPLLPMVYRITIRPIESVASYYRSKLRIEQVGNPLSSSVLVLRLNDPVPQKAEHILSTLIEVYNEEEIKDENQVLRNTLKFIDERVVKLNKELNLVEGGIEEFKSLNFIITDDASSSMSFTLTEIRSAINELSNYEVRRSILASLEELLTEDQETLELIPANLTADNPSLASLVNQYNLLVLERNQLATVASPRNPTRLALERQLSDIRNTILQTLQNLQRDIEIPIARIQKDIKSLKEKMGEVPTVEKRLLEQMRTQAIKESLYLFLLQKREETALSEAITAASTRTIEKVRSTKAPVYPQKRLVYTACAILGLLIPLIFITIWSFLETRIDSEDILKQYTSIPILGRIALHKSDDKIVVSSGGRSVIDEMFRQLRTNLNYLNLDKKRQVLLVTSSISAEGKTFVALNLALSLALSNKKVILIGMDLRKPTLYKYLGLPDNDFGLTNYLIGDVELPDVIKTYKDNPHLSYITSGPIPPNPAELNLSERTEKLFGQLSGEYDYVVIDTPPIGLVTDALLLRRFVSNILIVVRHKYSTRDMMRELEELYQNEELPNSGIVLNGIKRSGTYSGYKGYGNSYGQGYYVKE